MGPFSPMYFQFGSNMNKKARNALLSFFIEERNSSEHWLGLDSIVVFVSRFPHVPFLNRCHLILN